MAWIRRKILIDKMGVLLLEIDEALNHVDNEKIRYLNNYKIDVENVMQR